MLLTFFLFLYIIVMVQFKRNCEVSILEKLILGKITECLLGMIDDGAYRFLIEVTKYLNGMLVLDNKIWKYCLLHFLDQKEVGTIWWSY